MAPSQTFAQAHSKRVVRVNPSRPIGKVKVPLRRGESLVPHGFLASLKAQGTISNHALQHVAQEAAWQAIRRQEEGAATAEAPSKTIPPTPAGGAIETARRLFLEAMEAYRTGAYSAAVEGFQRVREMPGLPDEVYACSLWNIGQCFLKLGNREAAAEYVRAYLASPGISEADRTEAESVLAEITGQREGESVAGSVEQAPTGTVGATPTPAEEGPLPTDPVARGRQLHEQAVRFYGEGNYGEALARFGQIMEISGLPANVYTMTIWNMARCYQGLGNIPMAFAMLRGYLAQEGLSSADRAEAADLLRQLAGAGAEEAGERLPETMPSPPAGVEAPTAPEGALPTDAVARGRALYAQAAEAYGAGRYPEALALFRQIVDIAGLPDQVHQMMLWNMAMCHRRMGNNMAAIAMLRTFLAQPGISDADRADAQALIAELQGTP